LLDETLGCFCGAAEGLRPVSAGWAQVARGRDHFQQFFGFSMWLGEGGGIKGGTKVVRRTGPHRPLPRRRRLRDRCHSATFNHEPSCTNCGTRTGWLESYLAPLGRKERNG